MVIDCICPRSRDEALQQCVKEGMQQIPALKLSAARQNRTSSGCKASRHTSESTNQMRLRASTIVCPVSRAMAVAHTCSFHTWFVETKVKCSHASGVPSGLVDRQACVLAHSTLLMAAHLCGGCGPAPLAGKEEGVLAEALASEWLRRQHAGNHHRRNALNVIAEHWKVATVPAPRQDSLGARFMAPS